MESDNETLQDLCGKCEAEVERSRRVDFTLKGGTRVCDACFVKETPRPIQPRNNRSSWDRFACSESQELMRCPMGQIRRPQQLVTTEGVLLNAQNFVDILNS